MKLYQALLAFLIASILISAIESQRRSKKGNRQGRRQRRRERQEPHPNRGGGNRNHRPRDCGPIPHVPFGLNLHTTTSTVKYACEPGFVLRGTDVITCVDGIWSVTPRCVQQSCSIPPSVSFATYNQHPGANPPSAAYTCNPGYNILSGLRTIYCNVAAHTWGQPPVCAAIIIRICGAPPSVLNAVSMVSSNGRTATYTCVTGYTRRSGTPTTLSCSGTTWPTPHHTTYPACRAVNPPTPSFCGKPDCGGDTIDPAATGDQTAIGGTVVYTCRAGLRIAGSNDNSVMTFTSTCQNDGTWTPAPTCEPKSCGTPPLGTGTTTPSVTQTTVGGIATYQCQVGFTTSAPATLSRVCQEDGLWSGPDPVCTQVFCPSTAIPTVANAAPQNANIQLAVGQIMQIFCDGNYVIYPNIGIQAVAQSLPVTCQADGTYSQPQGRCVYFLPSSCKEFSERRTAQGSPLALTTPTSTVIDVDGPGVETSYTVNCERRTDEVCSLVSLTTTTTVQHAFPGPPTDCTGMDEPPPLTLTDDTTTDFCTSQFTPISYQLSHSGIESLIGGTAGTCKQIVTWTCPIKQDELTLALRQRTTTGSDPVILYSPIDINLLTGTGAPGYCDCALAAAPCTHGCVCSDSGSGFFNDIITIPLISGIHPYVTGAAFMVGAGDGTSAISTQAIIGDIECCDPVP